MPQFLLFTLAGPLASFGEAAGHERRGTADGPTRSAVIGILGAALGIDRSDGEGQSVLAKGYGVAAATLSVGPALRDFHTYQSIPRGKAKGASTRAAALAMAAKDVATTITVREYLTDVTFTIAVWVREAAPWSLETVAEAIRRPVFAPSLGRRACPPAQPLAPRLVEAADALAALIGDPAWHAPMPPRKHAAHPPTGTTAPSVGPLRFADMPLALDRLAISSDPDGMPDPLPQDSWREVRWDDPDKALGWRFVARPVIRTTVPAPSRQEDRP